MTVSFLSAVLIFFCTTTDANAQWNLFSVSCSDSPGQWSDWTDCAWPHGDLRNVLRTFFKSAENAGCKVPPVKIRAKAFKILGEKTRYLSHPLYQRAPTEDCGYCARQAQCCTKARSFLTQSFRSRQCHALNTAPACSMAPLNDTEVQVLLDWYPDVEPASDRCDLSPYIAQEMHNLRNGPAYTYVEPLLCQVLGTKHPTVNCVSDGSECKCCCFGYKNEDGNCVADPVQAAASDCA